MFVEIEYFGGESSFLKVGPFQITAPSALDRNPPDWWQIEAITNIAASRVVSSWKKGFNQSLYDAQMMIAAEVADLADDGWSSFDEIRARVVRQRFVRGIFPTLFLGRTELVVSRVRALLEDIYGGYDAIGNYRGTLFTCVNGHRLIPALVCETRGKVHMLRIDDEDTAIGVLLRSIRFAKPGRTPKEQDPTSVVVPPVGSNPPRIIARDLTRFPPQGWPDLVGVIRTPSIRYDGTVSSAVGYDPVSLTWFEPEPAFRDVYVPENPTQDDVVNARNTLMWPIRSFPFVDGMAGAIAILLERVSLPLLTGPRPQYAIDAPSPGTGKTILARAQHAAVAGRDAPLSKWQETEIEMDKLITSMLLAGDEWFIADNVKVEQDSASFASLITAMRYKSRILGGSTAPELPNMMTVVTTGNKMRYSEEIKRRTVMIRLDAGREPTRRRFDFDPVQESIRLRPRLVEAALVLVRSWVVNGTPYDPQLIGVRGGFERWLHVIGGSLYNAGITGLPEALRAADERGINDDDDRAFIEAWRTQFGYGPVLTSSLVEMAMTLGLYRSILGAVRGDTRWVNRDFISSVLDRLEDRILRIGSYSPVQWRLIRPTEGAGA